MSNYEVIENGTLHKPVKAWVKGVSLDEKSRQQLMNLASMPFIYKWVAAMPDAHFGIGATVGSVIATKGAIIPAAVGVDLGCGMIAAKTGFKAENLPDNLHGIRSAFESTIPVGGPGEKGSWKEHGFNRPDLVDLGWARLKDRFDGLIQKHPKIAGGLVVDQLGTLGTGNHFIELCLDEEQNVWIMLHSGSRGIGNRIAGYFIGRAKAEMKKYFINLPDKDLAYIPDGTAEFGDYWEAINWAQDFALINRHIMLDLAMGQLDQFLGYDAGYSMRPGPFSVVANCHHNYVSKENHYGDNVWVTRKGAVRAQEGDMGIIPGSMGAKSFIVSGLGNPESFNSCSHGAGRVMSRTEARKTITLDRHVESTAGVECRKDESVLDESPDAYKDIMAVMAAQADLVEVVYTLKQVLCVKG